MTIMQTDIYVEPAVVAGDREAIDSATAPRLDDGERKQYWDALTRLRDRVCEESGR